MNQNAEIVADTIEEQPITKVIFRFWDGEVIALFPEDPSDVQNWYNCSSYMHIGQHSGADSQHIINSSRPATPEEYASLKKELESYPYNYRFEIRQRISPEMRETRKREWQRLQDLLKA